VIPIDSRIFKEGCLLRAGRAPARSGVLSAFTLLELLTVIGVLAVLAGLLLPVLSNSRRAANSVRCKSNLRQLGLALRMYIDENDCYAMFGYVEANGMLRSWVDLLAANVGVETPAAGPAIPPGTCFECPAFRTAPGGRRPVTYGYSDEGYAFQGLGRKYDLAGGQWAPVAVPECEVLAPAETIALGDGIAKLKSGLLRTHALRLSRLRLADPLEVLPDSGALTTSLSGCDRFVRKVHAGGANVAFGDGHVEVSSLRRLFDDTSDAALCRWNRDNQPHREWLLK
jgi:prepilin-type processing-associated H-X9-DG protein